jgi:serine O-acetyltransferase
VQDVPAGVTVVGIPAKAIQPRQKTDGFLAYGTPTGNMPDPVARALEVMAEQVASLQKRLDAMEEGETRHSASITPIAPPHVIIDNDRMVAIGGKKEG